MLIRSGLIQNVEHVEEAAFSRHWRDVHGPLAARLPNLRGYVQNHIVARGTAGNADRIHRIDGISQLWFDSVETMTAAMSSPEQNACVEDISSFLQSVTLAIQVPGAWMERGGRATTDRKLMAVYVGEAAPADIAADIDEAIVRGDFGPARYRLNPILGRNFIVDPSIARSEAPLVAVLEAYFPDEASLRTAVHSSVLNRATRLAPAALLAVASYTFIAPPV
jgi:uncharacterized protein (TIGR02118 family)